MDAKKQNESKPVEMKSRKVRQIRCHVGVQVKHQVLTSVDVTRHGVTMELMPMGVYIDAGSVETIIPYANIHSLDLLPIS